MNFTIGTSFSEFKKSFYGKTSDLSLYDCGDINLLKVVLDGLKVNYIGRWNIRLPFFYPAFLWRAWRGVQRRRHPGGRPATNAKARVVLVDLNGRSETSREGVPVSFYFDRLARLLQREDYIHVIESTKSKGYPHDIALRGYDALQFRPLNAYERQLRRQLLQTYARIKRSRKFDRAELKNIRIAIQSFFNQFKIWNELLSSLPSLRVALVQQHYHHEGLLLALRVNKIRAYEIQHGLIAASDIFYVFPKTVAAIRKKALFPDKILVYGEYWKQVLLKGSEFVADDIVVLGDFRAKKPGDTPDPTVAGFISGTKIILVSSQTFMHEQYTGYTKELSLLLEKNYPDWKIVLKLHPNEREESYGALGGHKNVLVTKVTIGQLFPLANIHISVYSTTLYDALGYGLVNFSLQMEGFEDYTRDIVRDGIAHRLGRSEDPIAASLSKKGTSGPARNLVYDDFEKHSALLHELLA